MNHKAIILGIALCMLLVLPADARKQKMSNSQLSEATLFFSQVLHSTDNPYIVNLAQESLERLLEGGVSNKVRHHVEVPLPSPMGDGPAAPVIINDRLKATFLVDTGATFTVMTPRLAERLNIVAPPDAPRIPISTANGLIDVPVVTVEKMAIGSIEINNVQVIIQDLGNKMPFAGLLGMNFFRGMDLTIRQDRLILEMGQLN